MLLSLVIAIFCLIFRVDSTEIAAVYKHGILMLQNADDVSPEKPLNSDLLKVNLPHEFAYPTALAYEPLNSTFFVADLNDDSTEIFSFSLKGPVRVDPLVPREASSAINKIVYDPSSEQLIWTDAENHDIYSINPSLSEKMSPSTLFPDQRIYKPRGITVDYCNEMLYWTERAEETSPTILMANLETKLVQTFKESKDQTYYQGIDYNPIHHELIWAETEGDDPSYASCRIMIMSLDTGREYLLQSFDNCYPFALTSDGDHVYWSDWSRNGIMRLTRKLPHNSLVKLVSTPATNSSEGYHASVFGIVSIQERLPEEDLCMARDWAPLSSTQSAGEFSRKPPPQLSGLPPRAPPQLSKFSHEDINGIPKDDDSLYAVPSSVSSLNSGVVKHRLQLVVIIGSACLVFMVTTFMLFRNEVSHQSFVKAYKRFFVTAPVAASFSPQIKKSKVHRKFGPKSKLGDGQLCPRDANDRVTIDIEDCCQMTLCDTPCYTNIKKEGKSYKLTSPSSAVDKQSLLREDDA